MHLRDPYQKQYAYSILAIEKQVGVDPDEDMTIEGMASTPTPDRMDDIVEPLGARFKLPMPLLWQHSHDKPVGRVEFAKPNKNGIPYKATLPVIKREGLLRDRVNEARDSIEAKLVTAVSIGFRAVRGKVEQLRNGGLRFLEWEWLELSLVTIPAQAEATIASVKAFDTQLRAASGHQRNPGGVVLIPSPGVSGRSTPAAKRGAVKLIPR